MSIAAFDISSDRIPGAGVFLLNQFESVSLSIEKWFCLLLRYSADA